MERADKIFTILVMAALAGVLVYSHRGRGALSARLNTPASPFRLSGPAYLTSALPIARRNDDYADPASYYEGNEIYGPDWGS